MRLISFRTVFVVCAVAVILAAQPAVAQKVPDNSGLCGSGRTDDPDVIVAACSGVINSGASPIRLSGAYLNRAAVYAQRDEPDYALALADLDRAIVLRPDFAMAYFNRGWLHLEQDNIASAIADLDRSIALDPTLSRPYYQRGRAYALQAEFVLAMRDLDRAVELDPTAASFQVGRCRVRIQANLQLDVARAACDAAQQLDPNFPPAALLQGILALKEDRSQDAWNAFDQALRLVANEETGLFGRGVANLRLGRTAEGQVDITAARAIDPGVDEEFAGYGLTP